jgi:fluoroacetyl-CoA thioesterase
LCIASSRFDKSLEQFCRPAKERIKERIVQRIMQRPPAARARGLHLPPSGGKDCAAPARSLSMKDTLRPGLSRTSRITIDRDRTIGFMGEEARVYATPRLISDIEMTCRNLMIEHSDEGEDSVGVEVALKHLAATLMGSTVEITVTVTEVDRRKVAFAVAAKDEIDQISAGTHTRFVVNLDKRTEALRAKAAKLAALKA